MSYLGLEIGGTKLQLGVGDGLGTIARLWRGVIDPAGGAEGIRRQIGIAAEELFRETEIDRSDIRGIGIGFGGPVDAASQTIVRSHQIEGWENFPIGQWLSESLGFPAIIGNDADLAGLAEAQFGAGRACPTVFYVTVGSGIGGGLILNGRIHAGRGRGAAEIGHLSIVRQIETGEIQVRPLEQWASGWGIQSYARELLSSDAFPSSFLRHTPGVNAAHVTTQQIADAAAQGDSLSQKALSRGIDALADAICSVIVLICPDRIVIGGGVSLIGEKLFFAPLRQRVQERVFKPFAGLTEIVAGELGETVVVHGALALVRQTFGSA